MVKTRVYGQSSKLRKFYKKGFAAYFLIKINMVDKMEIRYKHNKTKDEAYKAIDGFLGKLEEEYKDLIEDYSGSWNSSKDIMDFSLSARGFKISGNVQLYDNLIVLEGKLPLLAKLYQGKIESMIKKTLKEILS